MEGLYRKEGGARRLLAKQKKELFEASTSTLGTARGWRGSLLCRFPR